MEERKRKEIEWADKRRSIENEEEENKYCSNMKFYSVVRKTTDFIDQWINNNCIDKDVFEMACGNGGYARKIIQVSKTCMAADIAPLSIEQAKVETQGDPILSKIEYKTLDCENTGLPDNSFDIVCEGGALHHMDIDVAYREAARLLRPEGRFMCVEALKHNPLIQLYRKKTPHLRTEWEAEHILGKEEIMNGLKYFEEIEVYYFHLFTLFAVPFKGTFAFNPLLKILEKIDSIILKIPIIQWFSWQAVFVLNNPKKEAIQ